MHKALALYGQPKDPAHFKRYYEEKHLPLAAQMPGLLYSRHSYSIEGMGGPPPFFCVWEGAFANAAAMRAASESPIGQKVAADVPNYASGGVTLLHYDSPDSSHGAGGTKQSRESHARDIFAAGLQVRREMLPAAHADQAIESATEFTRPLQEIVTSYCFGEVWTRPQIDRRTRSMLTMALLVALGKPNQLRVHVRAAIGNGVTKEEIREVLLHSLIYCGVPAGVEGFTNAADVLKDMGLE
jgi:4-carboxymuconolactone decarboxylase